MCNRPNPIEEYHVVNTTKFFVPGQASRGTPGLPRHTVAVVGTPRRPRLCLGHISPPHLSPPLSVGRPLGPAQPPRGQEDGLDKQVHLPAIPRLPIPVSSVPTLVGGGAAVLLGRSRPCPRMCGPQAQPRAFASTCPQACAPHERPQLHSLPALVGAHAQARARRCCRNMRRRAQSNWRREPSKRREKCFRTKVPIFYTSGNFLEGSDLVGCGQIPFHLSTISMCLGSRSLWELSFEP